MTAGAGRPAAATLAAYAIDLRFEAIPPDAVRAAKACLVDAVACAIHGAGLPWSRIVAAHAESVAADGPCRLAGALDRGLALPHAALCLGAFAHAFELDSLRKPGAGVHPGATVALPALMASQAVGASGRDLIAAIVAGCEVMFRIGRATLHSAEEAGFHAPGITGTFGAAAAAGRLLGLDARRLAHAFGIAGSFSGGLLAFAGSGQGGMVKRLHLGRAAEGGVSAALLARRGFEAPHAVLDGAFGVLAAFCPRADASLLTRDLGGVYETASLCLKRYACHVTAQAPVERLRDLMAEHRFGGRDVAEMRLTVPDKVMSHHGERRPNDLALAQYSVPFCLAVAGFADPADPRSFSEGALRDPDIRGLAERIELRPGRPKGWTADLSLRLKDGRRIEAEAESFLGCPDRPFSDPDLLAKFALLTAGADPGRMGSLGRSLMAVEHCEDVAAA